MRIKAQDFEKETKKRCEEEAKAMYEQAEKEGYKAGYDKAVAETEKMKKDAKETLEKAKLEKTKLINELEPQFVDLAVSVINKILNDAKAVNPQIVMALIKKGLSETKITGDIFIHVSEKEYDTVIENKSIIPELNDPNANIEIVKDYSLESGGCILETSFGNIDCSIDEQFKKVRDSLYFILNNK